MKRLALAATTIALLALPSGASAHGSYNCYRGYNTAPTTTLSANEAIMYSAGAMDLCHLFKKEPARLSQGYRSRINASAVVVGVRTVDGVLHRCVADRDVIYANGRWFGGVNVNCKQG